MKYEDDSDAIPEELDAEEQAPKGTEEEIAKTVDPIKDNIIEMAHCVAKAIADDRNILPAAKEKEEKPESVNDTSVEASNTDTATHNKPKKTKVKKTTDE